MPWITECLATESTCSSTATVVSYEECFPSSRGPTLLISVWCTWTGMKKLPTRTPAVDTGAGTCTYKMADRG